MFTLLFRSVNSYRDYSVLLVSLTLSSGVSRISARGVLKVRPDTKSGGGGGGGVCCRFLARYDGGGGEMETIRSVNNSVFQFSNGGVFRYWSGQPCVLT